ncbi:3-hydroxyacyl-CoA dehydrogenase/enoyl-CoA hydratase family protein [Desertibaculum subflavum]|uniref:3-hydroxyacyl-CoA dehydrogenase/enoyl-CoA hydratase family protein n=1 Tax=Desertibaculum subflavum TaxID=2268458 RepID=UPI0034D17EA4
MSAAPAMPNGIKKVAVVGSGVMGAAIAAHCANAGTPVVLLDIVPKGANDRSTLARGAVEKMLKTKPAPFMHPAFAKRVTPGNLEDDLGLVGDCDWICEAIIENPEIKRDLYKKLDGVRKKGSIVSSNTSTIPLGELVKGLPESFAGDFAITHFFNPPRYMRLLEVVGGAKTRPEAIASLKAYGDRALGKEVIGCKDTPGFIGNRIGIYWSHVALTEAYDQGLTVEEADAIVGKPMGIPKTGIFGLGDLTGIDLGPHVIGSMLRLLPKSDPLVQSFKPDHPLNALTQKMIAEGYTGRKGKGGFYRAKGKEAIDLKTGEYRKKMRPDLASAKVKGLKKLVEHADKGGKYAWAVASRTLCYAADLVPEIADDIRDVDIAMKTGYAWKWGPFEQIDMLGTGWFADKLKAEGRPVPKMVEIAKGRPFYKEEGGKAWRLTPKGEYAEIVVADDAWMLADKKRGKQPIASNRSASLWDVGDGVACLEIHTKMNALDADVIEIVKKAVKIDKQGYKALIIGNDADNFSVGANVGLALFAANTAMWPVIEQSISEGQAAYLSLKYAPFPVVAAPAGMALGGGCEICLHAAAIQAHAESYMGLVEVGVGLLPGWGGCKELIVRTLNNKKRPGGPMPAVAQVFEAISTAKVATSAAEARDMNIMTENDGVTMNRRRLLADAKAKALAMVADYKPPTPPEVSLPGETARAALSMAVEGFFLQGKATPHDKVVSAEVAYVLSGGNTDITQTVTEKQLMKLELEGFMRLIKQAPTLDRIEHMLTKGRPLRN